jgi:hypothetical protein
MPNQKRILIMVGLLGLLFGLMTQNSNAQTKGAPQHIYVADTVNSRIVRFDDMTGKNWVAFGEEGYETNHFHYPEGLYVDTAGKI